MSADVPASGTNRATGNAAPSGATLAPGLVRQPFAPGRYATAIARTLTGTHDFQLVREQSVASFALTLTDDGAATACRGWRYQRPTTAPTSTPTIGSRSRSAIAAATARSAMTSRSS